MTDFSRILEAWEAQGGRTVSDKAEAATEPKAVLSRSAMEKARSDEVLDLHGRLKDEAMAAVRDFLATSRRHGARKVLIVHGKGLHSAGKSVLKDAVRQLVTKNPHVSTWGEASRQEGGNGATWVWLNPTV